MEELKDKLLKEMEEIPKDWESKVHMALGDDDEYMYYTRYGPGKDFTEGYDWIYVYFTDKISIKIFLNKHHESCF